MHGAPDAHETHPDEPGQLISVWIKLISYVKLMYL